MHAKLVGVDIAHLRYCCCRHFLSLLFLISFFFFCHSDHFSLLESRHVCKTISNNILFFCRFQFNCGTLVFSSFFFSLVREQKWKFFSFAFEKIIIFLTLCVYFAAATHFFFSSFFPLERRVECILFSEFFFLSFLFFFFVSFMTGEINTTNNDMMQLPPDVQTPYDTQFKH